MSNGSFHSLAEKRSWALHQAVASRLAAQPELIRRARRRVDAWLTEPGRYPYAERWRELLEREVSALALALGDTSAEMCTLRQASPFAGALDNQTRWQILKDPGLRP